MRTIAIIIAFATGTCFGQSSITITEYIRSYGQLAIAEQLRTGVPAAITIAQGIHESGAGTGDLALRSNNHFGIKCKSNWTGDKVYHDDDAAGECFRAYNSVADSYRDHSDFLATGKRYSFLFALDAEDYSGWAYGLKQAGYATNPKYPQILVRIIEENNLSDLTIAALDNGGDGVIWTAASIEPVAKKNEAVKAKKENASSSPDKKVSGEKSGSVYPSGVFKINHCKVIYAPAGTSLKTLAAQKGISLKKLQAYNDMPAVDKLAAGQLVYLQEKRKKGLHKTHEVHKGESAWAISQQEGMQLKKLLENNKLAAGAKLKAGQVLYLHGKAPRK